MKGFTYCCNSTDQSLVLIIIIKVEGHQKNVGGCLKCSPLNEISNLKGMCVSSALSVVTELKVRSCQLYDVYGEYHLGFF